MLFSTIGQIHVFLWMMAAGLAIGVWYALLAAVRDLIRAGFWLGLIADMIFGAGAAVLFCVFLVTANYGEVRFFAVLGVIIGCALFIFGLWPSIRRFVRSLGKQICRLYCRIKQNRLIKVIFR